MSERHTCVLCGDKFIGYGNNPEPLATYEAGRCCDTCNASQVIPARLAHLARNLAKGDEE